MSRVAKRVVGRTIYLIHFDRPLQHAQHYIGSAKNLDERLEDHRKGQGARIMAVLREQGIGWKLARTWTGDRNLERRLKNHKNATRMCPFCVGKKAQRRAKVENMKQITREMRDKSNELLKDHFTAWDV